MGGDSVGSTAPLLYFAFGDGDCRSTLKDSRCRSTLSESARRLQSRLGFNEWRLSLRFRGSAFGRGRNIRELRQKALDGKADDGGDGPVDVLDQRRTFALNGIGAGLVIRLALLQVLRNFLIGKVFERDVRGVNVR